MNWLYIAVMGYIVFSALRGFHKGFFRVAYSLAAWLITIVFIGLAVPAARDMIVEHTTIAVQIEKTSEKYIRKQINQMIEDGTLAQNAGLPWLSLPESVLKKTGSGTKKAIIAALEAQGVYKKLAKAAAESVISLIAFTIAMAVIQVILLLIRKNLNLISKLPGVNIANMILGFCAGVVKAFVVIWAVFALIKACEMLPASAGLIRMIEENAVLKGLYEQNRVLELVESLGLLTAGSFLKDQGLSH